MIQPDCFHPDEHLAGLRRWKTLDVNLKNIRGTASSRMCHPPFHATIGHTL
jgi:hypothetical protein